jgi:hypothetical protein
MGKLSEQRKGEIAIAVLMYKMSRDGILVKPGMLRELGDLSKKTGIPIEELEEFSKMILVRLIGRMYGMQHVSLVMEDPVKKNEKE